MSEPTTTESARPEMGVVEALARDDVERKKFLTMAGRNIGAGAAATGLGGVYRGVRFVLVVLVISVSARVGREFDRGDWDVDEQFEQRERFERSRDRQLRADARVSGVAVLRQGRLEWLVLTARRCRC